MENVALAVDFGGTKVEAALVTAHGALIPGSRYRGATGREASCEQVEAAVASVTCSALNTLDSCARLIGVGVGSAGPIDRLRGEVSPINVPSWRHYPLRDYLARLVRQAGHEVPVRLEVDGVAIVLAEHWVGGAQGVQNVLGMVVSTGVGGGIISGGTVLVGASGNAGHIGHIEVADFSGEATFGNTHVLEAIASGPHTVAWAKARGFVGSTGEDIAAAVAAHDDTARQAVEHCGQAVGHAIVSATALLDLELVTIGGGFAKAAPELFFRQIRQTVDAAHLPFLRKVRVTESGLSDDGPLIGAGALIQRSELLPK